MSNKEFLEQINRETVEALEKRWYALKEKKMQKTITTDEKNEIRRIERRIAKMRQW